MSALDDDDDDDVGDALEALDDGPDDVLGVLDCVPSAPLSECAWQPESHSADPSTSPAPDTLAIKNHIPTPCARRDTRHRPLTQLHVCTERKQPTRIEVQPPRHVLIRAVRIPRQNHVRPCQSPRGVLLKRREAVPATETAAIFIVHKPLDAVAMLAIMAPIPWLLPGLPSWIASALAISAGITLVALVALYVLSRRLDPARPQTWLRRFLAAFQLVRSSARVGLTLLVFVVLWAAELGAMTTVLRAVRLELPLASGLLVVPTLRRSASCDSIPGRGASVAERRSVWSTRLRKGRMSAWARCDS